MHRWHNIEFPLIDSVVIFARVLHMPRIDLAFHCHRLFICRDAKPIAQRKRNMGEEMCQVVWQEVSKLMTTQFIREVDWTTWLSSVVLVKKQNSKWRMCTDYTDLNWACPKDIYPFPNIDLLVDEAAKHKMLSFFYAYSSYNQIRMELADEDKITFIIESSNYFLQSHVIWIEKCQSHIPITNGSGIDA